MTPDELRRRVGALRVNVHHGRRAPHKPLLLLWVLARFAEGRGVLPYRDVERAVNALLRDFGPPYRTTADMPFWHLQSDGVWLVDGAATLPPGKGSKMPLVSTLRTRNPVGRLAPEVADLLREQPWLLDELVGRLLAYFPVSYYEALLQAACFDAEAISSVQETSGAYVIRRSRDPHFRERVLDAYEAQCTVCGFSATLVGEPVGLEAAHIQWHSEDGPDVTPNGLALCALHHVLFDRGAFTLSADSARRIEVAAIARERRSRNALLVDLHGRPIRLPRDSSQGPDDAFVRWHRATVFREPAREDAR